MNPSFKGKSEILVEFNLLLLIFPQSLKILSCLSLASGVFQEGENRECYYFLWKTSHVNTFL